MKAVVGQYHVYSSQYFTKNEYAIVKFSKPPKIQKVSHLKALAPKIISKNFKASSLAIPKKLDGSFLMN
jgi:hypothetical protein